MNINLQQLELNVNLHALLPGFLNRELHYVIASDENHFRFAELDEKPQSNEQRFYCFLTDKELLIPAGNVTVKKSYVLQTSPAFEVINNADEFSPFVDCIGENCTGKAIRNFSDGDIDHIFYSLKQKYGDSEMHLIKSPEFQHLLLILPQVEISISATMVYFKQRTSITSDHYKHLEEEKLRS